MKKELCNKESIIVSLVKALGATLVISIVSGYMVLYGSTTKLEAKVDMIIQRLDRLEVIHLNNRGDEKGKSMTYPPLHMSSN